MSPGADPGFFNWGGVGVRGGLYSRSPNYTLTYYIKLYDYTMFGPKFGDLGRTNWRLKVYMKYFIH